MRVRDDDGGDFALPSSLVASSVWSCVGALGALGCTPARVVYPVFGCGYVCSIFWLGSFRPRSLGSMLAKNPPSLCKSASECWCGAVMMPTSRMTQISLSKTGDDDGGGEMRVAESRASSLMIGLSGIGIPEMTSVQEDMCPSLVLDPFA